MAEGPRAGRGIRTAEVLRIERIVLHPEQMPQFMGEIELVRRPAPPRAGAAAGSARRLPEPCRLPRAPPRAHRRRPPTLSPLRRVRDAPPPAHPEPPRPDAAGHVMSTNLRLPIVSPHREVVPTSFDGRVLSASPATPHRDTSAGIRRPCDAAFRRSCPRRSARRSAPAPLSDLEPPATSPIAGRLRTLGSASSNSTTSCAVRGYGRLDLRAANRLLFPSPRQLVKLARSLRTRVVPMEPHPSEILPQFIHSPRSSIRLRAAKNSNNNPQKNIPTVMT